MDLKLTRSRRPPSPARDQRREAVYVRAALTFQRREGVTLVSRCQASMSVRERGGAMPDIEVLYFAECPNYRHTLDVLRELLRAEGMPPDVRLVTVETDEEARRQRFYGSPTVRVDGRDVVPAPEGATPALACRVYRAADGRLSPYPPIEAIVAALRGG